MEVLVGSRKLEAEFSGMRMSVRMEDDAEEGGAYAQVECDFPSSKAVVFPRIEF